MKSQNSINKNDISNNKKKVKIVKQDISWHLVDMCLEWIKTFGRVYSDKEFRKRLDALTAYIAKKITLPGDIVDEYIVLEVSDDLRAPK